MRDELQRILDNLEGSTFVKRLKAASRKQLEVAGDLNTGLTDSFGLLEQRIDDPTAKHLAKIAERERAHSHVVWTIQSDLEAYYHRVRDGKFKVVLEEMKEEQPVPGLAEIAEIAEVAAGNHSGTAIAKAEYWADTLDRWAEELVGPPCSGQCNCPPAPSLPPAIVLAVMKILEKEIDLREETRAAEQARPTLAEDLFTQRARALSGTQTEIAELVVQVMDSISKLEEAPKFGPVTMLLTRVETVMREAAGLLAQPETGPPTIAAETEAIELLLQAKRCNPKGGGGGGMTPGGGGRGETQESALALLDSGDEQQAQLKSRLIEQATGVAGSEFPAEFRSGLEAFFGAMEGTRDLGAE